MELSHCGASGVRAKVDLRIAFATEPRRAGGRRRACFRPQCSSAIRTSTKLSPRPAQSQEQHQRLDGRIVTAAKKVQERAGANPLGSAISQHRCVLRRFSWSAEFIPLHRPTILYRYLRHVTPVSVVKRNEFRAPLVAAAPGCAALCLRGFGRDSAKCP